MKWIEWISNKLGDSRYDRAWEELVKQEEENPFDLKNKTLKELCDWIGQWPVGSANRLLGEAELKRRDSRVTHIEVRIAIGVSALSLLLGVLSLIK